MQTYKPKKEKKLRMGRSRRSSLVSKAKTLGFESLFWNVAYF